MSKEARNKARELRMAQQREAERKKKRNALVGWIGGVVIVALLVAIVVVVVNTVGNKSNSASGTGSNGPVVAPATATSDGGIPFGKSDAPVKVQVWFDYRCPYCAHFEAANSGELSKLVDAGTVRLEMHPLNFLDDKQPGQYSTRAGNAFITAAEKAPDSALAFSAALYKNQPEEGTTGLTDDKIASIATGAGVPADAASAFNQGTYESWLSKVTQTALGSDGITGTPTVKINGKVFSGDLYTAGPLTQAVQAAAGGKG